MAEFIDTKYIQIISSRLDKFKLKRNSPYRANFRCPYCEDSKKSKTKARGWLIETSDGSIRYYCHNCFVSKNLKNFLKDQDHLIYSEYIGEKFLANKSFNDVNVANVKEKTFDTEFGNEKNKYLLKIKKIVDLKEDHPARKYVEGRQIPQDMQRLLYYSPRFKDWVNSIIPDKFENTEKDEPRLIIPFFDKNGNLFGFCGRSFQKNAFVRYLTIMLDESQYKFFGLDRINFNKKYFVFEGPIDSLFIENSIAMAGADANISHLPNIKTKGVIVYDNEPRNKSIVEKMKKNIEDGYSICIWPDGMKEKDINNMILYENHTPESLMKLINDNIYTGLYGLIRLNMWRKI